ncbi:hypothetical protein [Collimonas sp. PA-H2]|uniref:hypothetical protein n=1 Tax=Collimonas sp. PA-H2 TaxID=1881062 RepID=UPI001180605D|nr:hypothetical protein [Collimonas sp. PA-H2]
MRRLLVYLPTLTTLTITGLFLLHGPIVQLAHYNEFADQSVFIGVPHAADVFSNLGFAIVAIWGLLNLWPLRRHAALDAGWLGYHLFLIGLLLTALGSAFYHLAPDNARLVWDRLPIALACAGLLAGVRAETVGSHNGKAGMALYAICALFSIAWWWVSDRHGAGDLRPYLLLQGLPLILIPLWQWIYRAPASDRLAFDIALLLYLAAKIVEINDHQLFDLLGVISGHTLKHLLATAAAGVLVLRLRQRTRESPDSISSDSSIYNPVRRPFS